MWNFSNDRPVYVQIMDEIKTRIVSGRYKPGERIPSVRDLAEEARVNPNTMQKALSEIERDGYIISLRTSGKYVTDDAGIIEDLKASRAKSVVRRFAEEMTNMGISMDDTIIMLQQFCAAEQNNERGNDSDTNQGE
jgi:DNA-binding transcriptional regulator YhcF (GntR family)